MNRILVSSPFLNLSSADLRFLYEVAQHGEVHVHLWSDEAILAKTGSAPKFPYAERLYFLESTRYVARVHASGPTVNPDVLPVLDFQPRLWAMPESEATPAKKASAAQSGITLLPIPASDLLGWPTPEAQPSTGRRRVVVTGCYDLFHTGHIAFFEEVSGLGDLYVVVGHDDNIRLLKGEGRPLFKQDERRFIVGSIRFVTESLISSGNGWMDAEPEIVNHIKAQAYAVNEDGDKPEKSAFCTQHGIEYLVLKRTPKAGLARRSSTDLRGF
jgi:cytidyltransferase-like protein